MMLKMMKIPLLLLIWSFGTPSFAEGPYERVATVNNYDPLRQMIILDGTPYKLKGDANSNLIVSIREAGLSSLKGIEVSFQIDSESSRTNVIVDVYVPRGTKTASTD